MDFGIFDHVDIDMNVALSEFYADRMKLIEAYDRLGFYSYHVAEHHFTPLGMAPSPAVYLSAVAQHSKRMRFGSLVFVLPLYHPLRLAEEICMLDQMSGGRLDLGFGRGVSPKEHDFFAQHYDDAPKMYNEGLEVMMRALTTKKLNYEGEFYKFKDVPILMETCQKPHPPLWYGVHSDESSARAANRGLNIVSTDLNHQVRSFTETFRKTWREAQGDRPLAKMGIMRFIIVADTDQAARELARRAYKKWYIGFDYLFGPYGVPCPNPRPTEWDEIQETQKKGIAGSPETVAKFVAEQIEETGVNYFVSQFSFGDLALSETLNSVNLFSTKVIPSVKEALGRPKQEVSLPQRAAGAAH